MSTTKAGQSRIPKTSSSVHDVSAEKPPFGSRFLTDESDVWSQNAWDHVPPPDDQEDIITAALARQKLAPVPEHEKSKYNEKPSRHWHVGSRHVNIYWTMTNVITRDNFYKMNASNFFRNRKWLHLEFPDLVKAAEPDAGAITIAEIGCGAGNAIFPLLSANANPSLHLRAYDYSPHAVKLVQANPLYLNPPMGSIKAAVWDLTLSELPPEVEPESVNIVILVFVLSALHPQEWHKAITNIHKMLKPGGVVLFRDYGRYDLTQLRFKGGRLLEDNLYIRGDKTRVYFFELDELALLFTGSLAPATSKAANSVEVMEDLEDIEDTRSPSTPPDQPTDPDPSGLLFTQKSASVTTSTSAFGAEAIPSGSIRALSNIHPSSRQTEIEEHPLFSIEQLGIDRRLIVNRKRQLKMYRVWMQGKFRKLDKNER
ncbi:uncharacterized protein FIBRA_04751 [Fibroporia radiculosa]|uniref:tRNA N(3)-methylcytidine methyltransferase n=1 Tax=Fibroporia radiculosa TaxID=599839 RepID=J4HWQ0_9APHY|nr:uncharacterized protein FIBRA_04751 [Fibroporia radiculosa]CCM02647.1 predicted protein [Fibroporia radiculosa]